MAPLMLRCKTKVCIINIIQQYTTPNIVPTHFENIIPFKVMPDVHSTVNLESFNNIFVRLKIRDYVIIYLHQ